MHLSNILKAGVPLFHKDQKKLLLNLILLKARHERMMLLHVKVCSRRTISNVFRNKITQINDYTWNDYVKSVLMWKIMYTVIYYYRWASMDRYYIQLNWHELDTELTFLHWINVIDVNPTIFADFLLERGMYICSTLKNIDHAIKESNMLLSPSKEPLFHNNLPHSCTINQWPPIGPYWTRACRSSHTHWTDYRCCPKSDSPTYVMSIHSEN